MNNSSFIFYPRPRHDQTQFKGRIRRRMGIVPQGAHPATDGDCPAGGGSKGALGYDVWAMTKTKKPAPPLVGAGVTVVQFGGGMQFR